MQLSIVRLGTLHTRSLNRSYVSTAHKRMYSNPLARAQAAEYLNGDTGMAEVSLSQQQQRTHSKKPQLPADFSSYYADVCDQWIMQHQLPLVYHPFYNIRFFGVEKLHSFDSCKFEKIVHMLAKDGAVMPDKFVKPKEVSDEALLDVHSKEYIHELNTSNLKVVKVTELPALFLIPNFLLYRNVVLPMKYHAGGTILAAGLAAHRGWAINIGGGMHHAFRHDGMGWCPYDDIMLAARRLRKASGGAIQRVMVIDLDAHQGNGIQRDKQLLGDSDMYILDMYNQRIFPHDDEALPAANLAVPLVSGANDAEYLPKLGDALETAGREFDPDVIFFNAGTDVLVGDPLGRLAVSAEGVIKRDEMVWEFAWSRGVPICMTLSGGYTRESAGLVASSLGNLVKKFSLGQV